MYSTVHSFLSCFTSFVGFCVDFIKLVHLPYLLLSYYMSFIILIITRSFFPLAGLIRFPVILGHFSHFIFSISLHFPHFAYDPNQCYFYICVPESVGRTVRDGGQIKVHSHLSGTNKTFYSFLFLESN